MNQITKPQTWSEPGYTAAELQAVQEKWRLRFPPDLVDFLRQRRPFCVGEGFFDWILSPDHEIRQLLAWPLNGVRFDVEHNGVWWSDWGRKPDTTAKQLERLKEVLRGVPRLIPVYGRRYIPADPCEAGNPVLSVYQTDVVCYGENLADWLRIEFGDGAPLEGPPRREIAFWSEAVRRNERRENAH
jgi:hypothetical protein